MPDAGMGGAFDPWRVTTESCELILRRAFPDLEINSVDPLGEGWDSVVFLINESLVFRLPKRPAVSTMLERERALLLAIADLLPLPVPRYRHVANVISGVPYGVGGYPLIPGKPLSGRVETITIDDSVAYSLAGFLKALHGIDTRPLGPAIVEPMTPNDWWSEHWRLYVESRPLLRDRLRSGVSSNFARDWERAFTNTRRIRFVPVLVHRDLATDHVIIDERGRLAGIIDFGDAGLGDPAIDFAGLPESFAERVLSAYTEDNRERERLWIRRAFYQQTVPLHAIQSGLELDRADLLEEGLRLIQGRTGV